MAKLRLGVCGAAVLIAACLPMSAAKAALITETFDFTASGFSPAGSPVDPWTGSFTITFDPTLSGNIGPLALDAFKSNLDPTSYGTFVYSQHNNKVVIGDNCFVGNCTVTAGSDQAELAFGVTGNPPVGFGADIAATASPNSIFTAQNGSVALAAAGAPGPIAGAGLPGVLAMLVGGLMWWRRKLTFSLTFDRRGVPSPVKQAPFVNI